MVFFNERKGRRLLQLIDESTRAVSPEREGKVGNSNIERYKGDI